MISERPLVSVIMPAYNAETFIQASLESVLAQTYQAWEVIVIDDGSDDQTALLVQTIATKEPRIRLIQQDNAGVAAARNQGIQAAQGELIAPLDADDIWHPQNLEKQVNCFQRYGSAVDVVYTWSLDINEQGCLTGDFHASHAEGDVYRLLICHNFLGNASASVIRRRCLEVIAGYSEDFRAQGVQGCEDWDLYLRLAEQYQFRAVPEFLVGYRKLTSSMSGNLQRMAQSHDLMLRQLKQQHKRLPAYIYRLSYSSFLMYLARQSDERRAGSETLDWLRRTLKYDPLTPLLRFNFYALALRSYAMRRRSKALQSQPASGASPPAGVQFSQIKKLPLQTRFRLRLTILITHLLHRLL